MKLDYLLRETGTNLRRNLTLGLAATITVMVSLALVGLALIVQKGVDQATARWQDGVEFIVFLNPAVTQSEQELIVTELDQLQASAEIDSYRYVDQEQAYREFRELIPADDVEDVVGPEDMPPSYRVVPAELDANQIQLLANQFEDRPGVREVVSAQEAIRKLERGFYILRIIVLFAGILLLVISLLLIYNTIRMAMFARRREMEVMKLVGATNWFIRLPFMFEGLIQGLLGGLLAAMASWGFNWGLRRWLGGSDSLIALFQNFAVSNGFVVAIGIGLVLTGALIGTLASGIAANRFLDV